MIGNLISRVLQRLLVRDKRLQRSGGPFADEHRPLAEAAIADG
jgi:hypothetical protein